MKKKITISQKILKILKKAEEYYEIKPYDKVNDFIEISINLVGDSLDQFQCSLARPLKEDVESNKCFPRCVVIPRFLEESNSLFDALNKLEESLDNLIAIKKSKENVKEDFVIVDGKKYVRKD